MYADSLGQSSSEKLRADVERMVSGPGQSRLGAPELSALIALHRSIARHEPFVVVTGVSDEWIQIEATPGATVRVESNGSSVDAELTGEWTWRARRPAAAAAATVVADIAGVAARCEVKAGAASHGT